MNKIVLISCVSKKLPHKAKAKDLYISPLFKKNLAFAHSLHVDKIFILSAKYGLLSLEQDIEPYDQTLNTMSTQEIKNWAELIIKQMKGKIDFNNDQVIFLAGEKYRKFLIPIFNKDNVSIPLQGLSIGKQLQFLNEKINNAK